MIYSINSNAHNKNLPLKLDILGIDYNQEPIFRPNGMGIYQLFYCVKGSGEFISNNKKIIVSEGQILLIYPDVEHTYRSISHDWIVNFIGFSGSICKTLLSTYAMLESGVYTISDEQIFLNHIRKIENELKIKSKNKDINISALCYHMIIELCENVKYIDPISFQYKDELIDIIIDYLEKNYSMPITLTTLSEYTNRTKEYLCYIFKLHTGQTIMNFLQKIRIIRARIYLIQYPEKKVFEIANMCGFESESYFCKIFKKEMNITPEQYRKYY